MLLEKSPGGLFVRNRKPFESKIEFAKILAKRCTDPVRIDILPEQNDFICGVYWIRLEPVLAKALD